MLSATCVSEKHIGKFYSFMQKIAHSREDFTLEGHIEWVFARSRFLLWPSMFSLMTTRKKGALLRKGINSMTRCIVC